MNDKAALAGAAMPNTTELEEHQFCTAKRATSATTIAPSALLGPAFGPFRVGKIPEIERVTGLRGLACLTAVFAGSSHPAVLALRLAEMDATASDAALVEFDRLAALPRRRIIATYAKVMSLGRAPR